MKFLEKVWKNKEFRFFVQKDQKGLWLNYQGQTWFWKFQKVQTQRNTSKHAVVKQELIQAHLPGRIQKIYVKKSDKLKKGQNLLTLSAMKIEYSFKAEGEGIVEEIFCQESQSVQLDQNLIKIKYV